MSMKLDVRNKGAETTAVIAMELSTINEKLFTLHWGNRKGALRARPPPRRPQLGKCKFVWKERA